MENNKVIAVIDLKAFYSYVECIDRGLDPWKTPLVVADKSRSVNTIILSVTPFLKQHGVPSRLRIKDLPKGKFDYIYATPRMARYIEKSSEVVSIIMRYVSQEDIHVYSIDEAFVDLTTYLNFYKKSPLEIVEMIINEITEQTGLMATAGIGDNFFLAKVALDIFAKKEKNGIAILHQNEVQEKLWPITPLSKIWGIGERLEFRLNALGITTVGELATSNREYLRDVFGIMGEQLWDHANGIDDSDIREAYVPKERSYSHAQVLFRDYKYTEVPILIREMVDDLAFRMRNEGQKCNVVSLFVAYAKPEMGGFSRQMSLLTSTNQNEILYNALIELLNKFVKDLPIRHVGISFGKLTDTKNTQFNLFEDTEDQIKNEDLQEAIDQLHNKYGQNIILRASALTESSTAIERHTFIGGHKK